MGELTNNGLNTNQDVPAINILIDKIKDQISNTKKNGNVEDDLLMPYIRDVYGIRNFEDLESFNPDANKQDMVEDLLLVANELEVMGIYLNSSLDSLEDIELLYDVYCKFVIDFGDFGFELLRVVSHKFDSYIDNVMYDGSKFDYMETGRLISKAIDMIEDEEFSIIDVLIDNIDMYTDEGVGKIINELIDGRSIYVDNELFVKYILENLYDVSTKPKIIKFIQRISDIEEEMENEDV